jgi:ATP-dependent RNA helicase SUPV3L1/SUV3
LHERLTERFGDRRTSVLMRRLRENAMLETEIGKSGEVVVEGHTIGRLDGFMFAPEASAGGSDAKALHAAAQKALAGEIDARAVRLSQAPDQQFVLASDGAVRWLGDVVGKLAAGEDVLRPRLRVIADEHLSGAPRDSVQTRLDLWLKNHVEKLLAPLFTLVAADDISGISRGVAFQLVEALGVLERQKVAEEVKGLDQPARATLRKHGVRFGAYHIYVPALLKPAPRALAAQLWALKHGEPENKGLDALQQLAASGRTSIPVDKAIDKTLYRTVGYRVCGERAVRVDILERLADLIRPAFAWREGAPGVKPAGAIEGSGFIVSPAMTSLTGASGEDFASILRSLGYRMERRPKPAAAPPQTDVTSTEAENVPPSEPAPSVVPEILPAATEPAPEPPPAVATDASPAEPPPAAAMEAASAEQPQAVEEPEFIEVWRPGRSDERRSQRGRHPRRPPRQHKGRDVVEAQPAATASAQGEAEPAEPRPPAKIRHGHRRRPDPPAERPVAARRPGKERREQPPDPNSPFAKLAALKEQLEAKERR